jgi:16S rRNA (uracil1498-N3)-methyltransferase
VHRFYVSEVSGDICKLSEEESKHCIRVLRLQQNDSVEILNGKGKSFSAIIENANSKACLLKIMAQNFEPLSMWELHVAVAPTKNMARMEWLVEKLTEIGITKFIPVECHNSERTIVKTERLKKIAIEAMKQSGNLYLPEIGELIPLENLFDKYNSYQGQKFIPHCNDSERKTLSSVYQKGQNALILIGPEGDFTKEEVNTAINQSFIPVVLNEATLRTETAALVSAIALKTFNT